MRSKSVWIFGVVVWWATGSASLALAADQGIQCDPNKMIENVLSESIPRALEISEKCAGDDAAVAAKYPPDGGMVGLDALSVAGLAYFECASAQLAAASGDMETAKRYLARADADSTARFQFYHSALVTGWDSIMDATRGFIAEKSGDWSEARRWYSMEPTEYGEIRLADRALADGRYEEARMLAKTMLARVPQNANGWIVLGALAESASDTNGAVADYRRGIEAISAINHQFMPIYYFDVPKARSNVERVSEGAH